MVVKRCLWHGLTWLFCAVMLSACNRLPTDAMPPAGKSFQGVTLATWNVEGYRGAAVEAQLDRIAAAGSKNLCLIITAYQDNISTSEIVIDARRTPSQASVRHCALAAKSRGLQIMIKPHVNLQNESWRGTINPQNPEAWFDAYRLFITPWLETAESLGATHFVIGTELAGTLDHQELWRQLIADARTLFSGEMIYAASWDEAQRVPFWDVLDAVGVNAYFPVTDRHDAGRLEMLAGWQPWLNKLALLQRQTGKQILFTEIGYRSVDGSGMAPYDFTRFDGFDPAEQADLFWAVLTATADIEWIGGLNWWNWLADGSGGTNNAEYTPLDKPAELILKSAWAGQ